MGLYIGNGITINGNVSIQFEYPAAPTNVNIPVITGTVQRDNVLTTSTGDWSGVPIDFNYTYQWQRANSNVSGATTSTYLLANADVGQTMRSQVTATTATGSNSAFSLNTVTVLPALSTAPRNITPTSFNSTTASLTWLAPLDGGGGTITGYEITANREDAPGTVTATVAGPLSGNITGLVTGGLYRFTVAAINAAGTGTAGISASSIYIIPAIGEVYGGGVVIQASITAAVVCSPFPAGEGSGNLSQSTTFCNSLVTAGYSDWSIPSLSIMQSMATNSSLIGGYTSGEFWTNTLTPTPGIYYTVTLPGGVLTGRSPTSFANVRAVRNAFY
jgi:hypothetical protein